MIEREDIMTKSNSSDYMLLFNITQIQQTLVYELRTLNSNVKVGYIRRRRKQCEWGEIVVLS